MIVTRSEQGNLPKVYAFPSFFFLKLKDGGHSSVKRWTKKVDIFEQAIILVPVHIVLDREKGLKHWCLATIDMQRKEIMYYDSVGGDDKGCLQALAKYVEEEHMAKKEVSCNWLIEFSLKIDFRYLLTLLSGKWNAPRTFLSR